MRRILFAHPFWILALTVLAWTALGGLVNEYLLVRGWF
jgi:hypothetical protein